MFRHSGPSAALPPVHQIGWRSCGLRAPTSIWRSYCSPLGYGAHSAQGAAGGAQQPPVTSPSASLTARGWSLTWRATRSSWTRTAAAPVQQLPLRVLDSKMRRPSGGRRRPDPSGRSGRAEPGPLRCDLPGARRGRRHLRDQPKTGAGLDYYNRTVFEWITDDLGAPARSVPELAMMASFPNSAQEHPGGRLCASVWTAGRSVGGAAPRIATTSMPTWSRSVIGPSAAAPLIAERLRDLAPGCGCSPTAGAAASRVSSSEQTRAAPATRWFWRRRARAQCAWIKALRDEMPEREPGLAESTTFLAAAAGHAGRRGRLDRDPDPAGR